MSDLSQTASHHVGYVDGLTFTISLCFTYTLCITAIRWWIRRRLYGWDDYIVGASTLFIIAFYAASYVSLGAGLGKNLESIYNESRSKLDTLNRSTVARNIFFLITLYLSKCSVVAFLARTTKTRKHKIAHYLCFALFAVFGIGSVLAVTVDCGIPKKYFFWDLPKTASYCPSQPTRWQIVTGLDVFTEIVLAMLPLHLMWELQMDLKKKLIIIAAFYVRLPVIGFSIAGNYWAVSHFPFTKDPGLAGAIIAIWQEVEAAYSLAAVTISASKAFADAFATGFGWGDTFREAATQYALENSMNSRSATSRAQNSKRRSGGDFAAAPIATGNRSRSGFREIKKMSPTVSTSDEGTENIELSEKVDPSRQYRQNDYNYGRLQTGHLSEDNRSGGSWKKNAPMSQTEYQDPLEGEHDGTPLRLRPERKLRNTAIITSDPNFVPHHMHRPTAEGGSVESAITDDMVIVRNVDYSVKYDEAPILDRAQRNHYSEN